MHEKGGIEVYGTVRERLSVMIMIIVVQDVGGVVKVMLYILLIVRFKKKERERTRE